MLNKWRTSTNGDLSHDCKAEAVVDLEIAVNYIERGDTGVEQEATLGDRLLSTLRT